MHGASRFFEILVVLEGVGSFEELGFGKLIQSETSLVLYSDLSENVCIPLLKHKFMIYFIV